MTLNQDTVDEIVQRILSVSSPEKIILFGSAAAGKMTANSDIDLLVIENNVTDRRQKYLRIRRALRDLEFAFDIVLISSQWYEQSKDVVGGIAYPASKHGRTIYAA